MTDLSEGIGVWGEDGSGGGKGAAGWWWERGAARTGGEGGVAGGGEGGAVEEVAVRERDAIVGEWVSRKCGWLVAL